MRRTPAPTEPSERTTNGPISAVDLTCVPPQSSVEKPGISTTRTMSPYFSPKSIIAPSRRASSIGVSNTCTGRFWKTFSFTICSTRSRSSAVSACSCVKSKRSLSGRTAEPAWRTWSPSVSRSAWWSTCVAVWFAIVGKRTFQGTTARTRAPSENPSPRKSKRLVVAEPVRLDELGTGPGLVVELDPPAVADLPASGRVERRLAQLGEEVAVVERLERADLREHVRLRVADELRLESRRARELGGPLDIPFDSRAGDLTMPLHLGVVAVDVDGAAALLGELDRELEREPVRRGERERVLAGDRALARELLEEPHAAVERLLEALLLGPNDLRDLIRLLPELRVGVPHLLDDDPGQRMESGEADALRLDHGAADDPAEDVAAALVRRGHAVGDEERHPAPVVGEDPVRLRGDIRVAIGDARLRFDPRHDPLVAVGLVDRADVLEHRGAPLEAEPGIDVLRGQRRQRPVGDAARTP